MRVIQLSDLHLGPTDHRSPRQARANQKAWGHARRVAALLGGRPDADELVIVLTGDLTDEGHVNPGEYPPAVEFLKTLPGTVFAVPGNHDVGNFASSASSPTVDPVYLDQWQTHLGPDRFAHAADGHRLIGLNSMLVGSGLPPEEEQTAWLDGQLDAADARNERVWVFQHAPLFLRTPDEARSPREHYWCPAAAGRDAVWRRLMACRGFAGLAHGHVHRRHDRAFTDRAIAVVTCPALSGTHSEADYFPRGDQAHLHGLPTWALEPGRAELSWTPSGLNTTTRYVS